MATRALGTAAHRSAPAALACPTPVEVGMQLGRYELLVPIGVGGMAQVWAARQRSALGFTRLVALKLIRPEYAGDERFRAMFLEEAQLAARLRHTNIVEVLDLGEHEGTLFQVMTLVEGASLARFAKAAPRSIPVGVAARIVCDTLRGLHAAHTLTDDDGKPLHLVHRDVSPQNILVGLDGVAKIADFGIAKAIVHGDRTAPGHVKGKLRYIAPEQLSGSGASVASDLYAAGAVLWEAWCGEPLFTPDDMDREPRAARKFVPDLPAPLERVLARSLARSPKDRFESAQAMADALEDAAREAGVLATQKDVAEAMDRAVGDEVALLRSSTRPSGIVPRRPAFGLEPTPSVPIVLSLGEGTEPPLARPSRSRRFAFAAVVACSFATLVVGLGMNAADRASVRVAAAEEGPAAVAPPIAKTAAAPVAVAPVAAAPPATATASRPKTADAPKVAPARRLTRPAKSKRPSTSPPAPKALVPSPSFDNPYE